MYSKIVRTSFFYFVADVILIYFVSLKWWGAYCWGMASQKHIVCSENGSQILSTDTMWQSGRGLACEGGRSRRPHPRCFLLLIGLLWPLHRGGMDTPPKMWFGVGTEDVGTAHQEDMQRVITHIMRFPGASRTDSPASLKMAGES